MNAIERDPEHIARVVKTLRRSLGLTQENLADAAGVSTRTIEKIETGCHRPDEQTLRSLARATGADIAVFAKPSDADMAALKNEVERLQHKALLVKTRPIRTLADFRREFGHGDALHIDSSAVEGDEAIDVCASLADYLRDLGDIWDEVYEADRVKMGREIIENCAHLEELGYSVFMGAYRERLRETRKSDLVFKVTLVSVQKREGEQSERYAYVVLQGRWETLEEDRLQLPQDARGEAP